MPRKGQRNIHRTFWARIERRGDDECWPWLGYVFKKGYGRCFVWVGDELHVRPHRASWAIHHGPPGILHVLHHCDNRRCVNPHHLFLGTNADNMADMAAKGRGQRGAAHVLARLTDDDVRAMRASTLPTTAAIARQFGVSHGTARAVLTGRTWKHIK